MKRYLFAVLILYSYILFPQSLLIVANPTCFSGITKKEMERVRKAKCSSFQGFKCDSCVIVNTQISGNILTNENSDFGLEVARMQPYLRHSFSQIQVVFWHQTAHEITFDSLVKTIGSYDDVLFLDHYSEKKMFGLPITGSTSFETMVAASNKPYLGICYSSHFANFFEGCYENAVTVQGKYFGLNPSAKEISKVLGF